MPLLVELLCARYPEVGGQRLRGVLWLRAADSDDVLAGNDHAVPLGINLAQRARINREAHVGSRMGRKMHAGEPGKHAARSFEALGLRQINFDDFIPGQCSGVFDIGLHSQ